MSTTTSPLFDINQLNVEQQSKFDIVYNELKSNRLSYLQYKVDLQLKNKLDAEDEENEWRYELHRYLRARKWNINNTVKSILEMIKWRIDNHVDSVLENQSIILKMDLLRKIVPSINHGYTKTHRPLYIEKSGQLNVDKLLTRFTTEEVIQCHIYWLEFNCQLAREHSRQLGQHVETFSMITDLNGCRPDIRKVLHLFKLSHHIDENYYPERLGQIFVLNPPLIFPALWNLVKHWLDPVTKAKIIVIKKGPEALTTLSQYIDSDQLPHEYGGTCHSCSTYPDCIPVYDWTKDIEQDKREKQ